MFSIVADSCCDMTPGLRAELGLSSVPLTLTLGDEAFVDDDTLCLPSFMQAMKACKGRIGSAAPSPGLFQEAFEKAPPSFAVTLSSRLSGSYQSAVAGAKMAAENGADTHVFDSKSASAGEILLSIQLRKLIAAGLDKAGIIAKAEQFIACMKTYFVLENVENLRKNGRLNLITEKVVSILGLKPLLGSDGDGNIQMYSYARGKNKVLQMMVDTIAESGFDSSGQDLVITHCNNPSMAGQLKEMAEKTYHFAKIWVVPTRGVSSVYANNGGVILAYSHG